MSKAKISFVINKIPIFDESILKNCIYEKFLISESDCLIEILIYDNGVNFSVSFKVRIDNNKVDALLVAEELERQFLDFKVLKREVHYERKRL